MKKNLKHTITFSIVTTVTLFSLLCCCLTGIAQADTSETFPYYKIVQHDGISFEEPHSENHKDCRKDCGLDKFWTISRNSSFDNLKFKLSINQYNKLFLFTDGSFNNIFQISSFPETNQSPPGEIKNTVPIYLQNSILRI